MNFKVGRLKKFEIFFKSFLLKYTNPYLPRETQQLEDPWHSNLIPLSYFFFIYPACKVFIATSLSNKYNKFFKFFVLFLINFGSFFEI